MAEHIDDMAVERAEEEAPYSPRLVLQRMHDLSACARTSAYAASTSGTSTDMSGLQVRSCRA